MNYLIGVDVGTTSTKAVLFDEKAQVLDSYKELYQLYRDGNGMAEQNPDDLTAAVEKVIHDAADRAKSLGGHVLAVSFSNANQSVILLDKNHQRLTRAMTWADTRAREVAAKLKATPDGADIYAQTGTPIHPMSPLTKLMWLKQTQPEKMAAAAYVADIKSYLFWKLFGKFRVDISTASCTGFFNMHTQDWDDEILKLTGITRSQLPEIVDGTTQETGLTPAAKQATGLDDKTPFVYGAFDGALSNLGVGATRQDTVAITIGTSAAVRVATDHPVVDPEQRLFCYSIDRQRWVVGGPLNNGGDVFQWAANHLVDSSAAKSEDKSVYDVANQVIASVPAGAHGLLFHPFLGGERAPLWDANARGSFFGLNPLHTRADMLRAVMEGICMNIATVYDAVCDLVGKPASVTATGGFARSEAWKQMLADVLDVAVNIPESYESGCLGAVTMAMKSLGMIDDLDAVQDLIGSVGAYQPEQATVRVYQKYLPLFKQVEGLLKPAYSTIARLQQEN